MGGAHHLERHGAIHRFLKDGVDAVLRIPHGRLRAFGDAVNDDAPVRRRIPDVLQYRLCPVVKPQDASLKLFFQEAVGRVVGDGRTAYAELAEAVAQDFADLVVKADHRQAGDDFASGYSQGAGSCHKKVEGYCVRCAGFSQRLSGRSFAYRLFGGFNSVPPIHLRAIKRHVGRPHQLVTVFGMCRKVGYARADGNRPGNTRELEFLHHATQLFSDRPCTVGMRLRHQDGKFLSPVTANQVVLADVLGENLRDLPEHLVAQQVPELIIQLFEVIDVDHQQREPKAVALGRAQRLDDTSLKSTAVVDTGQPVGACHGLGLVQLHGIADADGADIGDRSEHANVFFLEVVWLRRLQHQDAECLFQRDQREAQLRTRFLEARDVSLRTGDVVLHHDLAAVEGGTAEAVAGRQLPLACHESSELARVGAHQ